MGNTANSQYIVGHLYFEAKMKYRKAIFLAVSLVLYLANPVVPANTDRAHHHHHQVSDDQITFTFDSDAMTIIAMKGFSCYVYVLKILEYPQVHTQDGLKQIETRISNDILNNNGTLLPLEAADLTHEVHHVHSHCL